MGLYLKMNKDPFTREANLLVLSVSLSVPVASTTEKKEVSTLMIL